MRKQTCGAPCWIKANHLYVFDLKKEGLSKKIDFKIIFSDNFREQLHEPLLQLNQAVSS